MSCTRFGRPKPKPIHQRAALHLRALWSRRSATLQQGRNGLGDSAAVLYSGMAFEDGAVRGAVNVAKVVAIAEP